jgi:predicted ATPase/DNA-binding SARP family transcriptional activator
MQFRMLGPLEAHDGAEGVPLGSPREQAVLAVLLINAGRVVPVSTIVDAVWDEDPPDAVVRTVRSYISRLRSRLGDELIATKSPGYLLEVSGDHIDASRFEELLGEARTLRERGSHLLAAERLAGALELWSGPALAGLEDYEFARVEATRLEELRMEALEARIDSDLALGRQERLVAELEQLVGEHPLREGLWRGLMLALYRSGRQAEALRAYQRARDASGSELGIEPSPELRDLEDSILMQREELAAPTAPPRRLSNLPEPLTSFIGRADILTDITGALGDHRCLTLIGVGGSGKTRLGIEAARSALGGFADGVRLVEFAAIDDGELVAEHIAAAIGEPGSHAEDVTAVLADYLADKQMLLVMDNCEHLVASIAEAVDVFLRRCPHLRVLATSREPLRTGGETVFQVPPLEIPSAQQTAKEQDDSESMRLFAERAANARRGFAIDDDNRGEVVAICRALDGIPLALELAAARVGTMPVAELAHRLDHRFDLLTQGARTAPPRQQTLRATIDWSHDLLTDNERVLFRRLAVFSGGWTLDAVVEVSIDDELNEADVLAGLTGLVDRCLVELTQIEGGSRYRMLETIRQYAFEQLVLSGETPAVARRHRDWSIEFAEASALALRGPDQIEAWIRLEHDHDNMRSAIRWSLDGDDVDAALRLIAALGWFWFMRGYWREAWRWLDRGLTHPADADPMARAVAIYRTGTIEVIRMNQAPLRGLLEEALATCGEHGDQLGEGWCLHFQGHAVINDDDAARRLLTEALEIFEKLGDEWAIAWSLRYLGWVAADFATGVELQQRSNRMFAEMGDRWNVAYGRYALGNWYLAWGSYEEAVDIDERAVGLATELGDVIWKAHATSRLGVAHLFLGDLGAAQRHLDEALEPLRLIGDDNCVGYVAGYQSNLAARRGRWQDAVAWLQRCGRIYQPLGNKASPAAYLTRLAPFLADRGDTSTAAVLLGSTEEIFRDFSVAYPAALHEERAALAELLADELADEELTELLDRGRLLSVDEAIEYVTVAVTQWDD